MKRLMMIVALATGLTLCESVSAKSPKKDRVEVVYFHGKQRCATCMAIEKNARETVSTMFADEVKKGSVVFRTVDISTSEGEKEADKYEVTWSSLFVNKWRNGKESRSNMTEFGFGHARKNPDGFKKGLAAKIRQSLK